MNNNNGKSTFFRQHPLWEQHRDIWTPQLSRPEYNHNSVSRKINVWSLNYKSYALKRVKNEEKVKFLNYTVKNKMLKIRVLKLNFEKLNGQFKNLIKWLMVK